MKYIKPIGVSRAKGLLARVYEMINEDFAPVGKLPGGDPAILHSLHPTLMFTWWGAMRETVLVKGLIPRAYKESIAAAISLSNDCSFCVDQHSAMLRAIGDKKLSNSIPICDLSEVVDKKQMQLIYWALSHQSMNAHFVRNPPFTIDEAGEIIGTATIVNYINRLVEIFLQDSIFSIKVNFLRSFFRRIAANIFKPKLRDNIKPGQYENPDELATQKHQWVNSSKRIALSWASFIKEVNQIGNQYIPHSAREASSALMESYQGEIKNNYNQILSDQLEGTDVELSTFLCKVAFEPHEVSKNDIVMLRGLGYEDKGILALVSWASLTVSLQISDWLWKPFEMSQATQD